MSPIGVELDTEPQIFGGEDYRIQLPKGSKIPVGFIEIREAATRLGVTYETYSAKYTKRFPSVSVGNKKYVHTNAVDAEIMRRASNPRGGNRRSNPKKEEKVASSIRGIPKYDGKIAASCVLLFREGKDICDVVVALNITFEVAKHLWKEYDSARREEAATKHEVILDERSVVATKQRIAALEADLREATARPAAEERSKGTRLNEVIETPLSPAEILAISNIDKIDKDV